MEYAPAVQTVVGQTELAELSATGSGRPVAAVVSCALVPRPAFHLGYTRDGTHNHGCNIYMHAAMVCSQLAKTGQQTARFSVDRYLSQACSPPTVVFVWQRL
jgi:hypothetical protein